MAGAAELTAVTRPTTLVTSVSLDETCGCTILLATETFQHTGSFKFRAAYSAASRYDADQFIAASSGNFGQALAYACKLLGKSCTIVMPANSAAVKVQAVRRHGGLVDLIDTSEISRAERVRQLAQANPAARVLGAYDDELVIEGNATLGDELARVESRFDSIVVPIGGGGLSAGIILGLRRNGVNKPVFGAEPELANDASRSLQAGQIVGNECEPQTIADGARTVSLGQHNWPILRDGLAGIIEVPEADIARAVRLLYAHVNLKTEPTGALSLAAILTGAENFAGKKVCCVVSGGNVDPEVYARLILEPDAK